MTLRYNPRELYGIWDKGFALDVHTLRSFITDYDEYGNPILETIRTELGEAVYRAKYKGDKDVIKDIADTVISSLSNLGIEAGIIIPIPPSSPGRISVPYMVSSEIEGRYGIEVLKALSIKEGKQIKNINVFSDRVKELERRMEVKESLKSILKGKRVIIFDDIYRSGATLTVASKKLKDLGVSYIYALTLTYTRVNR